MSHSSKQAAPARARLSHVRNIGIAAHVDADTIVRTTRPLKAIEAVWGPAPGKIQSDGRGVFVLGGAPLGLGDEVADLFVLEFVHKPEHGVAVD